MSNYKYDDSMPMREMRYLVFGIRFLYAEVSCRQLSLVFRTIIRVSYSVRSTIIQSFEMHDNGKTVHRFSCYHTLYKYHLI